MKAIGCIPARWASTRFEGKVLADIAGKPMIRHVWERSSQSKKLERVIIACDDERVRAAAEGFGAEAVMTPPELATGTDRVVEAVKNLPCDVVVNIQGDEPLIDCRLIDELVDGLQLSGCPMGTAMHRLTDPDEWSNPNVVKVVCDSRNRALYFSRAPIPCQRDAGGKTERWKHIGIYAYTKDFLMQYNRLPEGQLERVEKLEQLRALENGHDIYCVETTYTSLGVDTPDDVAKVVKRLNG